MRRWAIAVLLTLAIGCLESAAEATEEAPKKIRNFSGAVFYTSYEEALSYASKTSKPVLLYFRIDSCGWCRKFESEVLPKQRVKDTLNRDFVAVAIDIDKSENRELVFSYEVRGTPTFVFLTHDGKKLGSIVGFMDENTFLQVLEAVKESQSKF
jgi:thioredoxin-related protein